MAPSLADLPNEVLQHVLQFLPPRSVPSFQRICRRFNELADPVMWRERCRLTYRYWHPGHGIETKLAGNIYAVDWRGLFIKRQLTDRHVADDLDSILASQMGRIEKVQRILEHGYDAKDCLLRQYRVSHDAEDVLARKYHSDAILGSIHRSLAIQEWVKLKSMERVRLERALSAFDMFVLHDRKGDINDVTRKLDSVAGEIAGKHPKFRDMSIRERAVAINSYLRDTNYIGFLDVLQPQNPKNSFMGIALFSEDHSSLPLITCAVYCAVARRLGVDAYPCGIPWKVIVIIRSSPGTSLDSTPETIQEPQSPAVPDATESMFLFPSFTSEEIPVEDLRVYLSHCGVPSDSHAAVLRPTETTEMALRCARNLYHSVTEMNSAAAAGRGARVMGSPGGGSSPELDGCFYAALWSLLVLGVPPDADGPAVAIRRRNYLPNIVEQFETQFPTDIGLIEEHIVPLFRHTGEHVQLRESIRVMRSVDAMPKQIKRRTKEIDERVRYRVGQVFRHKRYEYVAVVTGWDVECVANEHWMAQMRVHELSRGRQQSFYHVLVDDKSVRYVAEENIVPVQPDCPESLVGLAGQHFKRWDRENRCFVSNILDEYPEG